MNKRHGQTEGYKKRYQKSYKLNNHKENVVRLYDNSEEKLTNIKF